MPRSFFLSPTPLTPDGMDATLSVVRKYQTDQTSKPVRLISDRPDVPTQLKFQMIFGDLGATEIINTGRHDLITGTNISYEPFKELSILNQKFDPMKILALADGSPLQFSAFAYNLEMYIPKTNQNNVAWDTNEENIVLEFVNLKENQYVEVQIMTQGAVYNDTIY